MAAFAISPTNEFYDGHQRLSVLLEKYGKNYVVDCRQSSRRLTEKERRKLIVYINGTASGDWNWDTISTWDAKELIGWGFDKDLMKGWKTDIAALGNMIASEESETQENQYIPSQYAIIIMCEDESKQVELLERFNSEGLQCKALLS